MDRARRAAGTALFFLSLLASVAVGANTGAVAPTGPEPAAVPTWPVSSLVLSEVMTGGASASDEFVELYNGGSGDVDLAGLEVVYATSSGSTVTRKATWATSLVLEPGRHLLIANTAGIFAIAADATYSGGFAATGGALVLRPTGGAPIDAVGWGDATNAFVEGTAVSAPPAGASIERRPGGAAGNGQDTNDNATDWLRQDAPGPQSLASAPTPGATPVSTGTPGTTDPPTQPPSADPSPSSSVLPTPEPTAQPSATPVASPSATPVVTATPAPTPTPDPATPTPDPATPSPSPSPSPSSSPTPVPSPVPSATPEPSLEPAVPIADARALADGTSVRIAGTLTTPLGALESGHGGFVEDATGGLALYLADPVVGIWPAGIVVTVRGELDDRFAQRTLRVDEAGIQAIGNEPLPGPLVTTTGAAGEPLEGRRLRLSGTTVGSPSSLTDGTAVSIDDGSGPVRVVISPLALAGASLPSGTSIVVVGPLGQRDSTGTGTAGYRLHVTEDGGLQLPQPSPTANPTPAPTATAGPTPTPAPTAGVTPSPAPTAAPPPSPAPQAVSITAARTHAIGTRVTVEGVVTAEAGRLGTPPLIAIVDATGGIVVKIPDGAAPPPRGTRIRVTGPLADPYGQLELRPAIAGIESLGGGSAPQPAAIAGADVGEATEGRLVTIDGTVEGSVRRATSGDISLDIRTSDGTLIRLMADASSGLTKTSFAADLSYRVVGIVGQRASRKGAFDGYRVWLRDDGDRVAIGGPAATPQPSGSGAGPGASPSAETLSIAQALLVRDAAVTVLGTVTVEVTLLDATGRRIVIEDGTAAVEVLLPTGSPAPPLGARLRIGGTVGRAYGAPRLKATVVQPEGATSPRRPLELGSAPGPAHEWRLVRISGLIVDLRKLGSRWRAELEVGGVRIPIDGLSGADIPVTAIIEGRRATITGIVRRPHPSATDRRFSIVPRGSADLAVGPADARRAGAGTSGSGSDQGIRPDRPGMPDPGEPRGPLDVDLAALERHVGDTVRVGGLIVDLASDGVTIDDGTAVAAIVLLDAAAEYLPLLEPGDAINATGRIERRGETFAVVVRDPAGLARVGDPADVPEQTQAIGPAPSDPPGPALASAGDPFGFGSNAPSTAGLLTIVVLSAMSAGVTLLRRRRVRRRLLATVATRLQAIGRTVETRPGRPPGDMQRSPEGPPPPAGP